MLNLRKLVKRSYFPLNRIEILSKNLQHNYLYLSSINHQIKVAPVLKSNAYGHGIVQVAKILEPLNPPFFCVDSLFEAYELLKEGIKTKILIMGYVDPRNLALKKLPFSYAVYTPSYLEEILKHQPQAFIHLFLDTGMHREGIQIEKLDQFKNLLQKNTSRVEGVMSHLAAADNYQNPLSVSQIKNFNKGLEILRDWKIIPQWKHLVASSGLLFSKQFKKFDLGNLARVGIALYGIDPVGKDKNLKPSLRLLTKIAQVKTLEKGDSVGYDFTFTAAKKMTLGVLPIGYNDGLDRRFSNQGRLTVDHHQCPVVGRVSMNITTIDLSEVKGSFVRKEVIVFSEEAGAVNSVSNLAKIVKTIPYDLLVGLSPFISRKVIK